MKPIVYWGATGQAKVLWEFAESIGFRLTALFENNFEVKSPFSEIPIYYGEAGFKNWLSNQSGKIFGLAAIGGGNGKIRLEIQKMFSENNIEIPIAVHPTAFVAKNARISEGCQILAQSSVCAEVVMGKSCIINTSASVDHECKLGDGVHIAPGAVLAGCVEVGDFSFVGIGAAVLPRIKIGSKVIIGAGSVVTKDIESGTVAYGNPARHIRQI
ncbi:MAG: acetyltransferase [Pyrinomonadaceae bacterium]